MVTRKIRVKGRVQGVGFRAALRHEARKLGVSGWVRNRADGSVEALLQGPEDIVECLMAWARRGPPGAAVAELTAADGDAEEACCAGFELRPSA
jgi:acylphosphatase